MKTNEQIIDGIKQVIEAKGTHSTLKDRLEYTDTIIGIPKIKHMGIAVTIATGLDYSTVLDDIKNNMSIKEIELVVLHNVDSSTGSIINQTIPTDVNTVISLCASKGITISMVKPHIVTSEQGDGFDRSTYNPTDKSAFFTNWNSLLTQYATLCTTNNISMLCVSCEMRTLTDDIYYNNWKTIIDSIRTSYPNLKLINAPKATEIIRNYINYKNGLKCIEMLLDYVSINYYKGFNRNLILDTLYLPLGCKMTNGKYVYETLNGLSNDYNPVICAVELSNALSKKILVTETGCTFFDSAGDNVTPNNITGNQTSVDQLLFFETVLPMLCNTSNIEGIFIWHVGSPFTLGTSTKNYIKTLIGGGLNV